MKSQNLRLRLKFNGFETWVDSETLDRHVRAVQTALSVLGGNVARVQRSDHRERIPVGNSRVMGTGQPSKLPMPQMYRAKTKDIKRRPVEGATEQTQLSLIPETDRDKPFE
jgi:hypothetical protein